MYIFLQKLQVLQNSAARLVMCSKKYDSVTPILKTLHWLPVRQRIIYKLLVICYNCYHTASPNYLNELLCKYETGKSLRSKQRCLLYVPQTATKSYGDGVFHLLLLLCGIACQTHLKQHPLLTVLKHPSKHIFLTFRFTSLLSLF